MSVGDCVPDKKNNKNPCNANRNLVVYSVEPVEKMC